MKLKKIKFKNTINDLKRIICLKLRMKNQIYNQIQLQLTKHHYLEQHTSMVMQIKMHLIQVLITFRILLILKI